MRPGLAIAILRTGLRYNDHSAGGRGKTVDLAELTDDLGRKEQRLRSILRDLGSCVVAFSGGVDSAYLAVTAADVLGDSALVVTAESPSYPAFQKEIALRVAGSFGLNHELIRSGEIEDPDYASNPPNRCYFCKQELYSRLSRLAAGRGYRCLVDGSNMDDTGDYRPGRAAGAEYQVRSPLIEAKLSKAEIRTLSERAGLPTWNLPASACLASRIPYGSAVTEEKLRMIENAEDLLRRLGFPAARVRHHGELARIEIAREDLARFLDLGIFDQVAGELRSLGFRYVTLDLEGYRTGRLNEALNRIGVIGS